MRLSLSRRALHILCLEMAFISPPMAVYLFLFLYQSRPERTPSLALTETFVW